MGTLALQEWKNVHNSKTSPERGRQMENAQKKFETLLKCVAKLNDADIFLLQTIHKY